MFAVSMTLLNTVAQILRSWDSKLIRKDGA